MAGLVAVRVAVHITLTMRHDTVQYNHQSTARAEIVNIASAQAIPASSELVLVNRNHTYTNNLVLSE
jgi:D-aminopeptidase